MCLKVMETENSYYLVTEMCGGGDLMSRICSRKRLDELETRRYIRQIVSAVDYLHKAGIIHRSASTLTPSLYLSLCLHMCVSKGGPNPPPGQTPLGQPPPSTPLVGLNPLGQNSP